jgi:hypothetical protein
MACDNCECENCPDDCMCENCTPEMCECKKEVVKPQNDFGYKNKMNGSFYRVPLYNYLRQFTS